MDIKWDKEPKSIEQKLTVDYIENHLDAVRSIINLNSSENLISSSFTPESLEEKFYTYEIRKENSSGDYLLLIWRGLRTGDAVPIIYGRIE